MSSVSTAARRCSVKAEARPRGGVSVTLPFDPSEAWGELDTYHVNGTLGGQRYRGAFLRDDAGWRLELGPSWCRAPGFGLGDEVELVAALEGPRSTSMGADVAAAFELEPEAARFFDSMPSFYRNIAARALNAAKRPETRAKRIAEIIDLAKRRQRER
jgi:bacteriocin resistance YdeI/OmpD-like protein/uncharacterized protein DUF1905